MGSCKEHKTPVPPNNPGMMAISARAYFYLLKQVVIFLKELPAASKSQRSKELVRMIAVFTTKLVVQPFVPC